MRTTPLHCLIALALLLAALAPQQLRTAELFPKYAVTDLGEIGEFWLDINDQGQVASTISDGHTDHAVVWDHGALTSLPDQDAIYSIAVSINNRGEVLGGIGRTPPSGDPIRVVVWKNGVARDLSPLVPDGAYPIKIDESGRCLFSAPDLLVSEGKKRFLPFDARAMNDRREVVGQRIRGSVNVRIHGCLWQKGKLTFLNDLGGGYTEPTAINNAGQVVGWSNTPAQRPSHLFLWQKGRITDLFGLEGNDAAAWAINDLGQVVGDSDTPDPGYDYHAVLWQSGQIVDLNTRIPADSGWKLEAAKDINNRGWIVGTGSLNGVPRAYLLTPAD